MNASRWQQIEAVFQKAVELTPKDRSVFLSKECRDDSELKNEVEKLLKDYDSAESFIESPVWTDSYFINSSAKKEISESLDELDEKIEDNLIGKKIGVYKLTKELGRGGMGAVYLGERDDGEFKQKVAVKLIKRGMDSDFIVRRFRHERQILASFDHPFIGRLLDGGTTGDGLPYFVMEFVEGDTLYNFCDKKRLTIRERLEIFRQICSAISYAHERAIIHRDIKPGNILFTKTGVPKLLDFGIAKVLDTDLIHESVNPTASMMRLMTPDYASPEQVCGSEITSSSDIYSLGILLYELLTGHRPYNFAGRAIHEVSRVICEVLPEIPSEILGADENLLFRYAGAPEKVFGTRNISGNDLKQILAGELDNIIMKSLAKDVSDRYASAEDFSEDLRRYLRGENVKAEIFEPKPFKRLNEENRQTGGKSLAVLPFKVLNLVKSENTGDDFLGVGLADALITRLSKIRRFVVRPTSSIREFEEKGVDPISAARRLDVGYILDGNIKKAGTRLRVTVQLLDVAKNSTVWATSIDETVTDLFSLEDTLSTKVIEALLPQLTGGELVEFQKRGTESAEAFEQYLRGRYYFNTGTEEGFAKAFVSFHSAISADPDYAHAYAGIANYYSWLGIYGVLPPQECFQPAINAAEKAVELDPDLAEAHATLGFAVHAGNFDHPKAIFHLTRALELNPHYADAFAWLAIVRFTGARFQEGLTLAERAAELDPLTPYNHHNIAWGLYYARRFDESIKRYQKAISDFPNYGLSYYGLSKILRFTGKVEEALVQIGKAKNIFGESIFIMLAEAECFAAAGDAVKAREKLEILKQTAEERYVSPYQLALVYCYLKDREEALNHLEKAAELNEAWLNWMNVEPVFDFVRDDSRFQKIAADLNSPVSQSIDTDPGKVDTQIDDISEAETIIFPANEAKRLSAGAKYAAAAVFIIAAVFVIYQIAAHTTFEFSDRTSAENWRENFLTMMNVKRLTTNGKSTVGAISPDGKSFAYTVKKDERQSLWLRLVENEEQGREIVPAGEVYYSGITFSPDGKFVYYSTFSTDYKERLLHRIGVAENSEPQKILDNVNSGIDFAPDGRNFVFYSFNTQTRIMTLQTAEIDAESGTVLSTKTLGTRKQPDYYSGNPAFSPDGEKIVYAVGQTIGKKVSVSLFVLDIETSAETPLGNKFYSDVMSAAWRKNADEIVISAAEKDDAPMKLLLLKYPSGETVSLTNDLSSYYEISLADKANVMLAAKRQKTSNLWSANLDNSSNAVQITEGADKRDGMSGVATTASGEIFYVAGGESDMVLTKINADGSNNQIIKTGIAAPRQITVSPDRRFIVFGGTKDGELTLWRYNSETGETSQFINDFAITPAFTPDGKFIVYSANGPKAKYNLHKISIEGGKPILLTTDLSLRPVVSPDGKMIACYFSGEKTKGVWKIAVLPIEGGAPVQIIETPDTVNLEPPPTRPLAWSPDNRSIFYVNDKGDVSNIYKIRIEENAKPEKITNFNSGRIFDFTLSADGKRLIFARGSSTSDIVMFKKSE